MKRFKYYFVTPIVEKSKRISQMVDKVCKVVPTWFLPKESKFDDKDVVALPNLSIVKEKNQEPPSTSVT